MDMVASIYLNTLANSLQTSRVLMADVDEAVRRILRIKHLAGVFDKPFTDPNRAARDQLTARSREVARQFARESMVLLKNDRGLLPLDGRFTRVHIAGPMVHARGELFGTWTLDGRAEDVTPVSEALKQAAPHDVQLHFAATADEAAHYAHAVDAVVLIVGEHPRRSGENANVSDLSLPPGQAELIEAVANIGKPIVLVVLAGRPLAITRQVNRVGAVLYAWHPGIEGGAALGDILFGAHAPAGRLPVTFPRATGQVPI